MLLYHTLGYQMIGSAVPISDAELFAWILEVQRLHLEPLRIAAAQEYEVDPRYVEPRYVEPVEYVTQVREVVREAPRMSVQTVERVVEVPQVQVQEVVRHVP